MSYEYKDYFKKLHSNESRKIGTDLNESFKMRDELNEVYERAALNKAEIKQIEETYKVRYSEHIELKRKADECEAKAKAWDEHEKMLNKVKQQLKIKERHARRDGDYSEAYAYSEALDILERGEFDGA